MSSRLVFSEELGLNNKLMFANRKAVAGGLQMQAMPSRSDEKRKARAKRKFSAILFLRKAKPPTEKTEEDVVPRLRSSSQEIAL